MDVCQYSGTLPDGEAGRIFFEGHIPSVMGAGLNAPMSAADLQELLRTCFLACQAGDAKFNFPRGFVTVAPSPPLKFAFQAIDLCQAWPGGIGIEHFTGGDCANFDAPMTFVHFLCCPKIGLDFAKTGFRIFWSEEGLDVLIQSRLVFLHGKDIVSLFVQDGL